MHKKVYTVCVCIYIYICNFHTKMNNLTQGSLGQAASSEDFSAEKSSDEAACPSEPWVKLFIFV